MKSIQDVISEAKELNLKLEKLEEKRQAALAKFAAAKVELLNSASAAAKRIIDTAEEEE